MNVKNEYKCIGAAMICIATFCKLQSDFEKFINDYNEESIIDLELKLDGIFNASYLHKENTIKEIEKVEYEDEQGKNCKTYCLDIVETEHSKILSAFKNSFMHMLLERAVKSNQFDFLNDKSEQAKNRIFNNIFENAWQVGNFKHDKELHPFLSAGYSVDRMLKFIEKNRFYI